MSPIDSITDDELQALKDRVTTLEQERDAAAKVNPCADALDSLWKDIILARKPNYGDWEYPGLAYRHIKCEFDDLLSRLAAAERVVEKLPKTADGVPVVTGMVAFYIDPDDAHGPIRTGWVDSVCNTIGFSEYRGTHTVCISDYECGNLEIYSTEAAALASKGGAS